MVDAAMEALLQRTIPRDKGNIFNTAKNADTNFFASDLTPKFPPCLFRIYICLDTAGIVSVKRTYEGNTVTEKLNSGASLTASCAYIFDISVDSGESINLQTSVGATVLKCNVMELPITH